MGEEKNLKFQVVALAEQPVALLARNIMIIAMIKSVCDRTVKVFKIIFHSS